MGDSQELQLGNNTTDLIASVGKGVAGAVPVIGPVIAEVIGNIIPNQRIDRITEFIRLLDERLKHFEQARLDERFRQPEAIDLLEDAFFQAARATSHERLEHIANVVAHGISAEELNQAETKRMLWLLGQLNDQEIVILRGKLAMTNTDFKKDAEFRDKHESLLSPNMTTMSSDNREFEEAALKDSYRTHLHDLGLLQSRFWKLRKGELPEFDDKTGMMKTSGTDVTRLGRMLLRYLNIIPEWYSQSYSS